MSDRDIFTYQGPDGQPLHADPLDAHLRFTSALGNGARQLLADCHNKDEPAAAAAAKLQVIAAARQAFGLESVDPLTGAGVPASHVQETLRAFAFFFRGSREPTESPPNYSTTAPPGTSPDPAALTDPTTSTP